MSKNADGMEFAVEPAVPDAGKGKLTASAAPDSGSLPLIVVDGTEGADARASIVISALHLAAPQLGPVSVFFVHTKDAAIREAVDRLKWTTGIDAHWTSDRFTAEQAAAIRNFVLYLAVSRAGYRPHQKAGSWAARAGAAVLMLQQQPDENATGQLFLLQRAAHDPAALCAEIVRLTVQR